MKIKPNENYTQLGTGAKLDSNVEYEASWASNQPDWQEQRKIFVHHPEPIGFLLKKGEYVITEADLPVDARELECLLKQWSGSVDIPKNSKDNASGIITLLDSRMLELLKHTKEFINALRQASR